VSLHRSRDTDCHVNQYIGINNNNEVGAAAELVASRKEAKYAGIVGRLNQ